ncbi:ATP-binding protein [Streptomyces sp. NPDC052225]|uniref:ATP-binding protein n=1 Tax=Streptomyces sp. NPDC052225 TaxID=3154949 RepID=UPI0034302171
MNHGNSTPLLYRAGFAVGAHSARHLRRILDLYLDNWGLAHLADDARLALTELVSNVVRHVPGRRCSVLFVLLPEGKGVRVEVSDGSDRLPCVVDASGGEAGRGLVLVGAVARDWGAEPLPGGGKTVWFEVGECGAG